MPIPVRCPECGVRSQYPDRYAGETVACKACGSDIDVPTGGPRSSKKSKKKQAANNAPWLILAGVAGFGVVGIIAAAVAFVMLSRPAAPPQQLAGQPSAPSTVQSPAAAPSASGPATGGATTAAAPGATPSSSGSPSPAATPQATPSGFQGTPKAVESSRLTFTKSPEWSVEADPPRETPSFVSSKPLKLKLDSRNLRDNALLFPVTASDHVGVAPFRSTDPLELYRITTGAKAGTVAGIPGSSTTALSPDGRFVAWSQAGFSSVVVYDVQEKRSLGELPTAQAPDKFRVASLGIPRPDRLVAVSLLERGVKVWELPSGNFVCHIPGDDKFSASPWHAYSPGGRYLAVNGNYLEKPVEIYDLDTGKLAGRISIDGKATSLDLGGLGFSADGTELAILYDITSRGDRRDFSQFVVWNLKSGEIVSDFDLSPRLKEQLEPGYQKERLESFPNGKRWLVHSRGIIDRDKEQLIYSYPKVDGADLRVSRRVMGEDWLAAVALDKSDPRLEVVTIDEKLLAAAAETAAAGGLAIDADLPPLTAADFNAADAVLAVNAWSATADPATTEGMLKETIPLDVGGAVVRDVILTRGTSPRVVLRIAHDEDLNESAYRSAQGISPEVRRNLNMKPVEPVARKTVLDVYDPASGDRLSRQELPFSGSLLSVSPNGKLALIEHHRGEGRLDLFSLEDNGQPVVAWRAYRAASDAGHRPVRSAAFLNDEHMATLNSNGELVVWAVDGVRPVFRVPTVLNFAVSPGGKHLVVVRGNTLGAKDLALFDAHTGEGRGVIPFEGKVSAIAVHPNGRWFALSHGTEANKLMTIRELETGDIVGSFPVPDTADWLQWTGDDFLLLGDGQLVSRQFQATVWSYQPGNAVLAREASTLRCVFALPSGNRWQLRAAELPHREAASKLDGGQLASLALVKPGDTVGLKVTVGGEPELATLKEQAAEQVRERLTAAELTVAEGTQPVQITVDIGLKTEGTTTLSKIGDRSVQETVTVKKIEFQLAYRMGQKTVWQIERRIGNLDRVLVRLNPGEAAQAGTDRTMLESASRLLTTLELPSYVFGDEARKGLGTSTLAAAK